MFANRPAAAEIYTLSLHDALPICLHAPAGTGASGLATGAGAQGSRGVGPDVSAACPGRLTRDLRSRFTLIPASSSSPGCSFLPLHAPGARRLERTSEQNPSFGDRGGSHGPAARPVVSTSRLV